uniref:Lysozyme n=1 Tax=Yersinia enterocolitica W22703 TaxID=913028 RepID=F4N5M0_YEREN|nr:unknown protein [Yersinia enterocolitica W22703]
MQQDLAPVQRIVDAAVKIPLSQYQKAALYSFTYNVGQHAFIQSTLLKSSIPATSKALAMSYASGYMLMVSHGKGCKIVAG